MDDAPTWTEPQAPLDGATLATGAPPVPLSVDDGSLASVKALNVAVFAPTPDGQNFTLVVQDAPGATAVLVQLPEGEKENWKSAWLGVILELAFWVKDALPVFERVMGC